MECGKKENNLKLIYISDFFIGVELYYICFNNLIMEFLKMFNLNYIL